MQFAKITNGKVEKILAGSKLPNGYTVIPNEHHLQVGDDVKFFDKNYKKLTPEQAEEKGLIEKGEHQTIKWENGGYVVKADYRNEKYWYKETGDSVQFQIGDEPDETMTNIEPPDYEAVWDTDGWVIPTAVKEQRIRTQRDELLKECDFIMMPDYPLSDKSEWAVYRQSLRDITEQDGFPDDVVWPEKPEV